MQKERIEYVIQMLSKIPRKKWDYRDWASGLGKRRDPVRQLRSAGPWHVRRAGWAWTLSAMRRASRWSSQAAHDMQATLGRKHLWSI